MTHQWHRSHASTSDSSKAHARWHTIAYDRCKAMHMLQHNRQLNPNQMHLPDMLRLQALRGQAAARITRLLGYSTLHNLLKAASRVVGRGSPYPLIPVSTPCDIGFCEQLWPGQRSGGISTGGCSWLDWQPEAVRAVLRRAKVSMHRARYGGQDGGSGNRRYRRMPHRRRFRRRSASFRTMPAPTLAFECAEEPFHHNCH